MGHDSATFLKALSLSGLDALSERPGDLIDLLEYWATHGQFGTLTEMMAESVRRKLKEENSFRPATDNLSPADALLGAEQLAAALVLCKTFLIKTPGEEAASNLVKGAIDAREVLGDWNQHSINALLRRGLFAPSTYGRIRFHHRSVQEYLAACWLKRLLDSNCSIDEIRKLLFAEPYGVGTAVPALLPVTAWLALWVPEVRNTLIEREPVALILHGDARSLPLESRERLLLSYAKLDAEGKLNASHINERAAWMFSEGALAKTVRQAWGINSDAHFRSNLLKIIEQGQMTGCVSLAKAVALDSSQGQVNRLLAARALKSCQSADGLRALAKQVCAEPDQLSAWLAPQLVELLYPSYLSTAQLLDAIRRSEPPKPYSSEGFAPHLASLHAVAPARGAQQQLVEGIAKLVAHHDDEDMDEELSPTRQRGLKEGCSALALAELEQCGGGEVSSSTLQLLMAIERFHGLSDSATHTELRRHINADHTLKRQLMWADAATDRYGRPREAPVSLIQHVLLFTGYQLWELNAADLEWLIDDVQHTSSDHDRMVAFTALIGILNGQGKLDESRSLLEQIAGDAAALRDCLESAYQRKPDRYDLEAEAHRKLVQDRHDAELEALRAFRDQLVGDPGLLSRDESFDTWEDGLWRLHDLTDWLKARSNQEQDQSKSDWQLIAEAYSPDVATHYMDGMRQVWRRIKPERPIITGDRSYSTKYSSTLAFDAVAVEASGDGWPSGLNHLEVLQAISHALCTLNFRAPWVEALIAAKPDIVLPEITKAVRTEYRWKGRFYDIIQHAAYNETSALPAVTREVFKLVSSAEPAQIDLRRNCMLIVARGLTYLDRKQVRRLVQRRLKIHLLKSDERPTFDYLGILALLDPEDLARLVVAELKQRNSEGNADFDTRVQRWLGTLFDHRFTGGLAASVLPIISVALLADLLRLAYAHAPRGRSGSRNEYTTEDAAESARNELLGALLARPGHEAFAALSKLSRAPECAGSEKRLQELAHSKAQADADIVAWKATEVFEFSEKKKLPAKNGLQLLNLTFGMLKDLAHFHGADASSRSTFVFAREEEHVQEWLAERLTERKGGRFHVHREAQVAERNEPDIVISSTASTAELAIEIKHANKGWTVQQLEKAITSQLVGDYLRTPSRRHGILVVTMHRRRRWKLDGEWLEFPQLIKHLESVAANTVCNRYGSLEVKVVGIDACDPQPKPKPNVKLPDATTRPKRSLNRSAKKAK
ncbi:hypothetical protein FQZ97_407130 [compost metagenome]